MCVRKWSLLNSFVICRRGEWDDEMWIMCIVSVEESIFSAACVWGHGGISVGGLLASALSWYGVQPHGQVQGRSTSNILFYSPVHLSNKRQ